MAVASQHHVADQHLALPPVSEQYRLDVEWFDRSRDDGLEAIGLAEDDPIGEKMRRN